MSFGGGGSGALPNHEHTNIPLDGGPLDFVNTTIASLTANSMTYSDGAALQELTIGADAQVLGVSGGAPTWITNTSNPLIKVTKTFADIVALEMDIYTLPEDSALVNIWADITTVFDLSTAVTIGDAGDDNGFQEATDWTAGTGLTDATRGAYVTSFKTMRSTSGTTAIKAYNFTAGGSVFSQPNEDNQEELYPPTGSSRIEVCQKYAAGQVLIGEDVCRASFFIRDPFGTAVGTIRAFIRESDGTEIQESSTTVNAASLDAVYTEYYFDFPNTTISADDMICINSDDLTAGQVQVKSWNTNIANGTGWELIGTTYSLMRPAGKSLQMNVDYACTSESQGAVDFYLQVVN